MISRDELFYNEGAISAMDVIEDTMNEMYTEIAGADDYE